MKQIVFFAFYLSVFLAHAQDFAPIGARWHYTSDVIGAVNTEQYELTSVKDSVILGKSVRKIDRIQYRRMYDLNSQFTETITNLVPYFVHQDADSIFLFDPYNMEFDKIYVFNVKKGDTITLDVHFEQYFLNGNDTTYKIRIDSVATEYISPVQSKKYRSKLVGDYPIDISVESGINGWYRDKIGYMDWFAPREPQGIMEIPGPLLCYIDSQINYPAGVNCETITSNVKEQLQLGSVYPNPAKDRIWIKSTLKIDKVEIYSMQGSLLGTSFSEEINTGNLNSGQYLLKIYSGNDFVVKPVVVE